MAGFETLLDRIVDSMSDSEADKEKGHKYQTPDLPQTAFEAFARGVRGRCPSCGKGRMFPRLLEPIEHCPLCGQDWSAEQADDFPAYIAIIVTGHILAPVIIYIISETAVSLWTSLAIIISMALALIAALLQPAKGGVIALQWWMGLNGFEKPARPETALLSGDGKTRR